jgi:hypothetical protein
MKKSLMRVVNTTLFSKFFKASAFVLVLSSSYAAVQASPAPYEIVKSGPGIGKTEISHVRSDNQSLIFEVKVENASGEKFIVIVKDDGNNTLYRGSFNDKAFSKKFKVQKGDTQKVTFIIKGESGSSSESFEINSNTRVIEEVVVTKIS